MESWKLRILAFYLIISSFVIASIFTNDNDNVDNVENTNNFVITFVDVPVSVKN
jgi:hypothetical protein